MDVYNGVYPAEGLNASWLDDENLTVGTIEDIHHEFTEISGMSDVTVTADADSLIQRFRITGTLEGQGTAVDNADAAQSISQALDSLMLLLKADLYINNFDYTVGYFTDVAYDKNTPQATFNILGSLRHRDIDDQVQAGFVTPYNYNLVGNPLRFFSQSKGYIKAYDWSFEGGSPSTSNDLNPLVVYGEVGYYPVSLTVGGKHETSDTMLKEDYVRIFVPTVSDKYCSATHGSDLFWISRVALNIIDNPKDHFPADGYADFSQSISTPLLKGQEYPISVDINYLNSPNINVAVWIDLNQDGEFQEEERLLFERLYQNEPLSGASIIIPADAVCGVTRLRVRVNYLGDAGIEACGHDAYLGYAEDYSVIIFETLPDPLHLEITGIIEETDCVHGLESVTINNASISGSSYASVRSGGYIAISDFMLTGSAGLSLTAASQISIQAPASIMPAADCYFHAMIDVFEPCQLPVAMVAATEKTADTPFNAVNVDLPVSFFRIYPNPAKSQFNLELTGEGDSSTISVEIKIIMGNRISYQVLARQSHYLLKLPDTPEGIYLVRVRSGGRVGQERLIIAR